MQLIAGLIVILVLGAGGYWAYQSTDGARDAASTGIEQVKDASQTEPETKEEAAVTFAWQLTDAGEDPLSYAPRTKVELVYEGRVYDLGVQTGSCAEVGGSGWEKVPGEISGVICWFAGGGTELGVFDDGNGYVVKLGQLDEGNAEIPGMRGAFETILMLDGAVQ